MHAYLQVAMAVRQYLVGQRFVEVETPTLFRATPEGAREFIVPTRQKVLLATHPPPFWRRR